MHNLKLWIVIVHTYLFHTLFKYGMTFYECNIINHAHITGVALNFFFH